MTQTMTMNLFSESLTIGSDVRSFCENTATGRNYYIEGCLAQANVLNRNNRIYPGDVLFPDIARYDELYVKRDLAWGELDHPEKRVQVNMKEVSHRIISLRIEGDNVIGKAIITNSPNGQIVKAMIDSGGQLAVSTRGLGKSYEKNDVEYMEFYHMTAIDIVSHPSGIDCFPRGFMEGVDYLVEANLLSKTAAFKIINENDKRTSTRDFSKIVSSILKDIR
jgi:hypothetical protein